MPVQEGLGLAALYSAMSNVLQFQFITGGEQLEHNPGCRWRPVVGQTAH